MAATNDFFPSGKSELTKKCEIMKDLQQLRIREQNLEKEKSSNIYDRHGEFHPEFAALQELDMKSKVERNAQNLKMKQQYNKIRNMVKKFRLELEANLQPSAKFVEKLKVMMEDVEGSISAFKEQQRTEFEQLWKDERVLGLELAALDRHIDSWSQPDSAPTEAVRPQHSKHRATVSSARDVTADLPPEVATFEKFVQVSGGNRGGWDEYDHTTFLKCRSRFKGKVSFIKELLGFLPTRSEQEIRDHEIWYQDYMLLHDKKKEAIQKWRDRKEIEKEEKVANAGKYGEERKVELEEEEDRKKRAQQKEKEEQKVLLNRWKIEKELQKAEEDERRLREELEKQKKEDMENRKKMDLKRKVAEYKMMKEIKEEEQRTEEMLQLKAEEEARQRLASALISKYRDRDLEKVKQKRENEEKEKKRIETEKQERLDRLKSLVEVNVDRDPERLLQPTALWKERQRDVGPSEMSAPLLHMPRRAIPSWRQGLS